MRYKIINGVIQYQWHFFHINDIFEHEILPYSEKYRYTERDIDKVISHNKIPIVCLIYNKLI